MRTTLRSTLLRPVTLMVLPADSARAFRLRLPVVLLAGLALAWAGSVGAAAWLTARRVHYEAMRLLNAHLAARLERYTDDVARAQALAARLAPLERDLERALAGTRRTAERGGGVGGPRVDFLPGEIPARVATFERAGEELFRDWDSLASLAAATPSGWPVRGWLTSEFGERVSPYTGEIGSLHQGVDLANKLGSPITAAADGLVVQAGWTSGGYGKMVEIVHGYGYVTRYGHCSRLRAAPGQHVHRGDIIAYVGSTGNATGPHVHYEVRLYGVPVNPRAFMQ